MCKSGDDFINFFSGDLLCLPVVNWELLVSEPGFLRQGGGDRWILVERVQEFSRQLGLRYGVFDDCVVGQVLGVRGYYHSRVDYPSLGEFYMVENCRRGDEAIRQEVVCSNYLSCFGRSCEDGNGGES